MTNKAVTLTKEEYNRMRCKIRRYERFLHALQMHAEVVMNPEAVSELISNACRWSYAHRVGNGMLSDQEQSAMIERAFRRLDHVEPKPRVLRA